MNTFTIRDIENLSGIKAHTLRVWEQRYGIITPKRKESNHRLYDAEDLKQILRISYLYHQGYKISRIADMTRDQIMQFTLDSKRQNNHEVIINQLMEASIDLDEDLFREVFDYMQNKLDLEKSMLTVIYPFLKKVGLLWMTGNVLPAQEHFSSNLIRNKIYQAIEQLPLPSGNVKSKVILMCPPGEYHEIPLLFIHYLLKKNGNVVINFGSNTSSDLVKAYLEKNEANQIFIHLITNFTYQRPEVYVESLLADFPKQEIIASGPLFRDVVLESPRVKFLRSLEEMLAYTSS
jgi:DNA-binding transcriptional MerR regulator